MAELSRHGPEHPAHLHSAFEDPEVQQSTSNIPPSDHGCSSDAAAAAAAVPALPPSAAPPSRRRRRQHRRNSQPINPTAAAATAPFPGVPISRGILGATSSPAPRPPPLRGASASTSPPPSGSRSPSASPSPSTRASPSPSTCVSPFLRSASCSRGSAARYPLPSYGHKALDGAALAAACAAAPLNPNLATAPASYRSYEPSTHRGGLRRADESSGALNNIHPDILGDLRALDDLEGGSLLRPLLTQPPQPAGDDDAAGASRGPGGGGEGRVEEGGEGGGGEEGGGGGGHVDEDATYEVPQLLEEKPRDVLQFIEEEGVVKLSEIEVADGLVLKAFGSEPFLVLGHEHAEPPGLRDLWMERLIEGGKAQGTGWASTLAVEAHVVNLYDAAAPGNAGLLRPLLARLRVHGCPPTVFALPAVQAVISLKWNTWARNFLLAEFVFYAAWLTSFSGFSLLLEDGADSPMDNGDGVAAATAAPPPPPLHFGGGGGGDGSLPVVRHLTSILQVATTALRTERLEPQLYGWYGRGDAAFGGGGAVDVGGNGYGYADGEDGCPARFLNPWDWGALGAMLASPRGFAQIATSTAAVAAMLPFAYMEVCTIVVQGLAWLNLFNLADVASYFLALAIWAVHLRCGSLPRSSWFSGSLALQHVLLWSKLHYYARVLTPTRGGFNDTIRMVLSELRTFLTFVGLVMMGFAFAFYCLFRQDRDDFADFSTLWHSFASMFAYMLQMFDYSVLYKSTHPVLAMILFMAYELMVAVLLLNIMIALMTAAFARVSADEGLRYLIYKAEVIDELESTLPRWLMRSTWFPHFVHVLKVSPKSTYEINLNSVWSGMSTLQSSLMNAQQETRLRVEALEAKMDVIDQKLSATVRLLASRLLTHSELAAALSMDDVAEAASDGSDEQDLDRDLDGEDGEPDPEKWRDADLDPRPDEQAVPEAPDEEYEDDGAGGRATRGVAALLRMRRGGGGGGGGSRRGSHRGVLREAAVPPPPPQYYRSGHYTSHPSPRRLQSAYTTGHHHPAAYHHSMHASHAASTQLPLRNYSHGHHGQHGGHSTHGHGHGHGYHQGGAAAHVTRGSSQAPSASASLGPSREPSIPAGHPHHARTAAAPTGAATSGARLHAFYSHGHGQSYYHNHQQQQQQREQSRQPLDPAATPPQEAAAAPGRSSGSGGGGRPMYDRRESYAGAAGPQEPEDNGSGDGGGFGGGDGGGGGVPEGSVVLDMRRAEERSPPTSPHRVAAWSGAGSAGGPPARDDVTLGHGPKSSYHYYRWYSTGGGAGAGVGGGCGSEGPSGGGGGGGGGTTAPAMASIAEHGSPSLAGSDAWTDSSPQRRSETGANGARGSYM